VGKCPRKIYTRKIDKIWVNELEIYGPNCINVPEKIYTRKIDKIWVNVPEIYDLKNRQMWKNEPDMIHSTTNYVSITFLLIFTMVQY